MSARHALIIAAKVLLSAGLLYLALRNANWGVVGERLADFRPLWFAAALLVLALQIALAGLRWHLVVNLDSRVLDTGAAIRFSYIANFFGQTFLSTLGADASRTLLAARAGVGWRVAFYSVLADRVFGITGISLLVLLAAPSAFALIIAPAVRGTILFMALSSIAAVVLFLSIAAIPARRLERWAATRQLHALAAYARAAFLNRRVLAPALAYSLAIHLLTVFAALAAARAVSVPFAFADAFVIVPPVVIAAMFPVSVAGWGVREGAMVTLFFYAGMMPTDGLIVSVLLGLASLAIGLGGGALWIIAGGASPSVSGTGGPSR